LQDVRYAFRILARDWGFSLVAILTLGFGIGLNNTVFTLVNAALFKGLPFPDAAEIVHVGGSTFANVQEQRMSYPDFEDIRRESRSFKGLAASSRATMDLSDNDNAARVNGAAVTTNTFSFLRQRVLYGRDFTAEDERPGADPVVIISYDLWKKRFAGSSDAIGKTLRVNRIPHTVLGVLPQGIKFPVNEDFWIPLIPERAGQRDRRTLDVVGRIGAGNLPEASAELTVVMARVAAAYPDTHAGFRPLLVPYTNFLLKSTIKLVFLAMQGAVGFVLVIVCASLAALLLSRAAFRTREMSVRAAVGASRSRLIRQLLIESVILSLVGGLVGLGIARSSLGVFVKAMQAVPWWLDLGMDYRVFSYFLAICLVAGILFGLAPALQITKTNIHSNLVEGGHGVLGNLRTRRWTTGLLVGQLALTIVLLAGAGVMLRSYIKLERMDAGIRTDHLLAAEIEFPPENRSESERRLLEEWRGIPEVEAAAVASHPPVGGTTNTRVRIEGRSDTVAPGLVAISANYFETLGATLKKGREFSDSQAEAENNAVIVNEAFAARFWPGEDPLRKRVQIGEEAGAPWLNVIGVSSSIRQYEFGDVNAFPIIYVHYRERSATGLYVLIRTQAPAEVLLPKLKQSLHRVDADIPLLSLTGVAALIKDRSREYRVFGRLFGAFALLAAVVSAMSLYAVTAYGMNQRIREIALRIALGATSVSTFSLVLRSTLKRIITGLSVGWMAAIALSPLLLSLRYERGSPKPAELVTNLFTFAIVSALVCLVMLAACLRPAIRALRLDPAKILRTD
jgi:predicted permease